MVSIKSNILYIILFSDFVNCLVELSEIANNDIALTEKIIRHTVRNLFFSFRIKGISQEPRIKLFSRMHRYFISITLKDCVNMKEVIKLTRLDNADSRTEHIVSTINEIMNEGAHTIEESEHIFVKTHADIFLRKLKDLKMIHEHLNVNKNTSNRFVRGKNRSENNSWANRTVVRKRNHEFWRPSQRRIYLGHVVRIKRYPFTASVLLLDQYQCVGSIIKSDLVITSSSCLQIAWNNRFFRENPTFLSVRVGTDFAERGGEMIPVLEVYFHPQYDPKSLRHNLAIMRLTRHIHFSRKTPHVKKIDFDRNPEPLNDTTESIIVLGWGARDSRNYVRNRWRNRLMYAKLDVYPLSECREVYSKALVTRRHFCGGFFSKGGGACNRDAGGPGVIDDKLVGVISFGSLVCGAPSAPTVFTKLGSYTDWIEEIMEQDVPHTHRLFVPTPKTTMIYTLPTTTTFTFSPLGDDPTPLPLEKADYDKIVRNLQHFNKFLSSVVGEKSSLESDDSESL